MPMPGCSRNRTSQCRKTAKRVCAVLSLAVMIAAIMTPTLEACCQEQAEPAPPRLECYCCKNSEAGSSCCALDGGVSKIAPCTCDSKKSDVVSTDLACVDGSDAPAALSSGSVQYHPAGACRIFDPCKTIDRPPPA